MFPSLDKPLYEAKPNQMRLDMAISAADVKKLREIYSTRQEKMASGGASLQNYNNELVKCIEDLREKREEINRQILREEEEKGKIQRDLSILTDRLSSINEALARKLQARTEYDKTIQETESAYMKILESSQTLLQVLKRETVNLGKKKQSSS